MITFCSDNRVWVHKEVDFSVELTGRPRAATVCCHTMYSRSFRAAVSKDVAGADAIRATRCINASDGSIAYSEVRGDDGVRGPASILVWSRSSGRDGLDRWKVEVCANAAQIFAKEGYKRTGLPA